MVRTKAEEKESESETVNPKSNNRREVARESVFKLSKTEFMRCKENQHKQLDHRNTTEK